jgi:hypothetical protein
MSISLRADVGGSSGAVQVSGVDKLLVGLDGSLVATANPATGLRSMALATMQKFDDEFPKLFADPGYQKLPSGLIFQWGFTGVVPSGSTGLAVTFPIAFPTVAASISTNFGNNAAPNAAIPSNIVTLTTTGFTITQQSGGGAQFLWFAVGY